MLLRWLPAALGSLPGAALVYLVANDLAAVSVQELAQQGLAGAVSVDVGGVDEIDAGFEGPPDQAVRFFLLQLADVAPDAFALAAESHGAQAQFGHPQPTPAQQLVPHLASLLLLSVRRCGPPRRRVAAEGEAHTGTTPATARSFQSRSFTASSAELRRHGTEDDATANAALEQAMMSRGSLRGPESAFCPLDVRHGLLAGDGGEL